MKVAPVAIVLRAVLGAGKIDLPRKKPKAVRRMPFGVAKGCNQMYSRVIPHAGFIRAEAYSVHPVADPGSALIRRTGPQRHS
jgi:hypothetical protein